MPSVTTQIGATTPPSQGGTLQYSPPNWNGKALYSITVNTTTSTSLTSDPSVIQMDVSGAAQNAASSTTMFVFDGMKLADHDQSCIPTQHPLQAGYNIADHAVLQPARLVLEVLMSDAIAAYSTGMWTGNPSKSISAFQQMQTLMQNRALLTISTRLQTYNNMLLVNVKSQDSQRHYSGQLSMILTFQQIFIGTIAIQSNSAREQTTGSTEQGTVNGQTPDATTLAQHVSGPNNFVVTGSGPISSNLVTQTIPLVAM
jgi:hypothetical protein